MTLLWHFHDTFITHVKKCDRSTWTNTKKVPLIKLVLQPKSYFQDFCVCLANCKKYHTFYMWVLGMSEGNTILLAEYFYFPYFLLFLRTRLCSENNTRVMPNWHQNRPTMVAGRLWTSGARTTHTDSISTSWANICKLCFGILRVGVEKYGI